MHLQKRNGHSVLYLSRETQSIRIPRDVLRKAVTSALAHLPPGTHNRRKLSIDALNRAGIKAS